MQNGTKFESALTVEDGAGGRWRHAFRIDGAAREFLGEPRHIAAELDLRSQAAAIAKASGYSCGGCQTATAEITTWLGVRWIGEPWPKRIRLRLAFWPFRIVDSIGCGCLLVPKLAVEIRHMNDNEAKRLAHFIERLGQ